MWDAVTKTGLQTHGGHEDTVYSVAWNPAGTRIVSGSWDSTLRIWDATGFEETRGTRSQVLEGHEAAVLSVDWNAAGTRIVPGSSDKPLRLWDAETGERLQIGGPSGREAR
mgnify:CR=1 FL=1